MPTVFTQAGIPDVPIGGEFDIVLTGELFERVYDHLDEDDVPRDFTGLSIDSAVVFDPLAPATTIVAIVASFGGDPTLGILTLSIQDANMPAAGQYSYRIRAVDGTPNKRTIQAGRFTVGDAAP